MVKKLLQGLLKRATMRSPQGSEVVIYAREHKGQVWIKISDDGPPVSTMDLLQFLEKSPLDLGTGSLKDGLELIRAKTLLDRLGGQLWVGGSGPRGSAITVCLPAVLPSSAA
jgi:signal transduction histidine kinase